MDKQLKELISYQDKLGIVNKTVSNAAVGWHIQHTLQVINGICLTLMRSKEKNYNRTFNFKKTYILLTGHFPRGKAKAPKVTNDTEDITLEAIQKHLSNSYRLLEKVKQLPKNSHFNHSIFGKLNLKESKKFLRIHTEHHLKIIRSILK